jgi:hypothetical protein
MNGTGLPEGIRPAGCDMSSVSRVVDLTQVPAVPWGLNPAIGPMGRRILGHCGVPLLGLSDTRRAHEIPSLV